MITNTMLAMIPEEKASPNLICNQSKVSSDLEYSVKVCLENCEKISKENMCDELMHNAKSDVSPICADSTSNDIIDVEETSSVLPYEKFSVIDKFIATNQKKMNRPSPIHLHKPAEVFRKDLISAMKIPDTSLLPCEEYWVMQDPWRIEWEKGVQVPVNYEAIPKTSAWKLRKELYKDFKMPRKMIKSKPKDGDKTAIDLVQLADSICRYDLDELDVYWLQEQNRERDQMGLKPLDEYTLEQIMETLENQCYNNMQLLNHNKEGDGIEYDENVVCDVCRQPDSDESNEMVFCDGCNLAVHQACYGILKVPEGSWLCKPCTLGVRGSAECILCGRKGGAMKSSRSGHTWAHVICALWIPETSFADPVRMEPIAKISHVPASRWALLCIICKERVGACIQCSIKQCVTAYHATCAVEAKLDMYTESDISNAGTDSVVFRSYCKKHSKDSKESTDLNKAQKANEKERQNRIMEVNEDFDSYVDASVVETTLNLPTDTIEQVAAYWRLKRRANFNAPLLIPKNEENATAAEAAEMNLKRRLRLFTHIRQDLERVRNLCYMVCRREKLKATASKNVENVFLAQMKALEYRMKQGCYVHSPRLKSSMQKIGQPQVCEIAHKESTLLEQSKYWNARTPEKKTTKPFKKSSPHSPKNGINLNFLTDDVIGSSNKATENKRKRRLSFNSKSKVERQLSSKRSDILKRRQRRTTPHTNHQRPTPTTTLSLRKRSLSSSETDVETENLRPSPENSESVKKSRLAQGQLFEANFVLSDETRAEAHRTNASVLSDTSTHDNSIDSNAGRTETDTVRSGLKRANTQQMMKKSPLRACRNVSMLKRQLRLRRKSAPSYFCAKPYQCYVLY